MQICINKKNNILSGEIVNIERYLDLDKKYMVYEQ